MSCSTEEMVAVLEGPEVVRPAWTAAAMLIPFLRESIRRCTSTPPDSQRSDCLHRHDEKAPSAPGWT